MVMMHCLTTFFVVDWIMRATWVRGIVMSKFEFWVSVVGV